MHIIHLNILCVFGNLLGSVTSQSVEQQSLASPPITFRDVETNDIPALTSLIIAAFSPGPIYHYIAPDLADNYSQIWHCMNTSLTKSWETRNRNTTIGKVIAVGNTPVSVAIWDIRINADAEAEDDTPVFGSLVGDCATQPGINTTRMLDFNEQLAKFDRKYFRTAYSHQLYLNLLATHPSWDGNGFAARHIQWGKELSLTLSETAWPVTLLATPAGWPLYDSSALESDANVTVRMLDGLGDLWFEVMSWKGV